MPPFYSPWKPPADVFYSGNQWLVKIELAGITPDEVEIIAQGAGLVVRGRRRDLLLRQGFSCHSMEISYSNFERSFSLPDRIVPDSIGWDYQQGILLISFTTEDRGTPS